MNLFCTKTNTIQQNTSYGKREKVAFDRSEDFENGTKLI